MYSQSTIHIQSSVNLVNNLKLSRSEAILAGQKVYWRDSKCPSGHFGWFRVGGGCVECQKAVSKKYKEKNRSALKEKQAAYARTQSAIEVRAKYMDEKGRSRAAEWVRNKRKNDPDYAEKCRESCRIYKSNNSESLKVRRKTRESNPEVKKKIKAAGDKWRKENAEKIREERREYYRQYMANRRKSDPTYKALTRMRDFVRRCTESIRGAKNWRTSDVLGYSPAQLKAHIEALWLDGMTWENYGEWHIDHKVSIKTYLDSGVNDITIINSLTNLQPLWAFDNLSKGAG